MSGFWRRLTAGAGLSALMIVSACGSGGSSDAEPEVRVLNAAPNEPSENVLIDSTVVSTNLGYEANTGYLSVNSGQRHLQVEPTNGASPIVDQTISVTNGTETTVIVEGISSINGLVLSDNNTQPASGTAMVRVVNVASNMGPADVYIVPSQTSLSGLAPTVPALAVGAASSYQSITIPTSTTTTTFDVYFTEPGTDIDFLIAHSISLTSGQNRTVVALTDLSGGFNYAILADLN
jgi:hypothetical protein